MTAIDGSTFFDGFINRPPRSGPDERFGCGIVMLQVVFDSGFQIGNASEDIAADGILGDQAEMRST